MSDVKPDLCEACNGTGLKDANTLCPACKGTPSADERAKLAMAEKANAKPPKPTPKYVPAGDESEEEVPEPERSDEKLPSDPKDKSNKKG